MKEILIIAGIFFVIQLINVILNTLKTLIMAKTDNKHASAIINAITYGFYTIVVQQVANLDLAITVSVTIITNIIGVYISYNIMHKTRKDNLWKIEIVNKHSDKLNYIENHLTKYEIPFVRVTDKVLNVYSYSQTDSTTVKSLIEEYKCKYNITVIEKTL